MISGGFVSTFKKLIHSCFGTNRFSLADSVLEQNVAMKSLSNHWGYAFGSLMGTGIFLSSGLSSDCTLGGKEPWRMYALVSLGIASGFATVWFTYLALRK